MKAPIIVDARHLGGRASVGLLLLCAQAAPAAMSTVPFRTEPAHAQPAMTPGIALPLPLLSIAATTLLAPHPAATPSIATVTVSPLAPRLIYPDPQTLEPVGSTDVTWYNYSVSAPRPLYGPTLFVARWIAPENDPNRLTSIVPTIAATRPLLITPPIVTRAPVVTAQATAPAPAPAPVLAPDATPRPSAPEDLRAAIVDALKSNPDIQIALARQDDARYGIDEAVAGYMPHADVAIAVGNEFNDPQLGAETSLRRGEGLLSVRQTVWDFGTTINDIKRARATYNSARWGTREKIEAISYEIANAYLAVLAQQKLLGLSEQELTAHQKILKMVTTQNDLGLTTPADVSRAKARLENVQAQIQDRKSAFEQARESYRRLTDHLPGPAVDVPSAQAALPPSADGAVAMIDDHSPRMAQAVQDRRSIERQRASQTGTFFPKVGLMAQANWRDNVQGRTGKNVDARGMATITYSFLNGGADVATRNRLSARLREADYEVERRRREVEQDMRIDFNALEAARAKMSTIDAEIAASEKVVQLYTQQFREGRRTVFDLLDSQQILFDARANQVTNGTAKLLAEFRVLQKLGGLFDLLSNGQKLPKLVVPAAEQKK